MNSIWAIGILSGLIGAAITAVLQFLTGLFERWAADRRHFRELALKAAVVQWEHDVAENKRARNAIGGTLERPEPLTDRDFDRILLRKLNLIESFGNRAAEPKGDSR